MPTASTNAETKRALNQGKHKLKKLKDGLSIGSKDIGNDIANVLVNEINNNYSMFVNSLSHDHQDRSDTRVYVVKQDKGNRVVISGSQVLYDEFGTGDAGLMQPHREKAKYNLNGYNTGAHIKTSSNGAHYWNYYSTKDAKWVTSQGVPAGMFVFNSVEDVANNIGRNIDLEPILKQIRKIMSKGK